MKEKENDARKNETIWGLAFVAYRYRTDHLNFIRLFTVYQSFCGPVTSAREILLSESPTIRGIRGSGDLAVADQYDQICHHRSAFGVVIAHFSQFSERKNQKGFCVPYDLLPSDGLRPAASRCGSGSTISSSAFSIIFHTKIAWISDRRWISVGIIGVWSSSAITWSVHFGLKKFGDYKQLPSTARRINQFFNIAVPLLTRPPSLSFRPVHGALTIFL